MLISFVSFIVFLTSILVVTSTSPITSVVYLIGTFILTAIYLSSQGMYYIALTYIVVYVGAVITLFLFVVIMINLGSELNTTPSAAANIPISATALILYTILIISSNNNIFDINYYSSILPSLFQYIINQDTSTVLENVSISNFSSLVLSFTGVTNSIQDINQIQSIGFELYTHQAMYLVIVSIVLMVSMIGPIVICGSSRKS